MAGYLRLGVGLVGLAFLALVSSTSRLSGGLVRHHQVEAV